MTIAVLLRNTLVAALPAPACRRRRLVIALHPLRFAGEGGAVEAGRGLADSGLASPLAAALLPAEAGEGSEPS